MALTPKTRVDLLKGDHNTELVSGKIPAIKAKLDALALGAPEQYRDKITIELEPFDYYGSPSISLDAYYYRDETKEERDERLLKECGHSELQKRVRREMFEKLKKEFEP